METLIVELSPRAYQALQERARKLGKPPQTLSREILEQALQEEAQPPRTTREILQALGRLRPLGPDLRRRIIPGVTIEEVRRSLAKAQGPSLSEIVLEQRGPKL